MKKRELLEALASFHDDDEVVVAPAYEVMMVTRDYNAEGLWRERTDYPANEHWQEDDVHPPHDCHDAFTLRAAEDKVIRLRNQLGAQKRVTKQMRQRIVYLQTIYEALLVPLRAPPVPCRGHGTQDAARCIECLALEVSRRLDDVLRRFFVNGAFLETIRREWLIREDARASCPNSSLPEPP